MTVPNRGRRFYHRTVPATADAILREGFRDATGSYLTQHE